MINRLSYVFPISFVYIVCLCRFCYFDPPSSHPTRSYYFVYANNKRYLESKLNEIVSVNFTFARLWFIYFFIWFFFISDLMPLFSVFSERKSRHSACLSNLFVCLCSRNMPDHTNTQTTLNAATYLHFFVLFCLQRNKHHSKWNSKHHNLYYIMNLNNVIAFKENCTASL